MIFFIRAFSLFIALFIWAIPLYAQKPSIGLTGYLKVESGNLSNATVTLYKKGKKVMEVVPSNEGKYELDLEYQDEYEIVYTSPGNVSKKIQVSTTIPQELESQDVAPLTFNILLAKATNTEIDDAYKNPISKLYFEHQVMDFVRDRQTEDYFKEALKSAQAAVKRAEEQRKKEEADLKKKKADEEARKKAEEEAKRKAEEDAKKQAEEEAKRKAEEEARRIASQNAQAQAQQSARNKAIQDSIYNANEAKRKAELAQKAEEERLKKQQADEALAASKSQKAQEEAEKKRLAEEARQKAADEALQKKLEEEKLKAEQRLRKQQMEDSIFAVNKARVAEAKNKKEEAEKIKQEAAMMAAAEAEKQKQAQAEAKKKAAADAEALALEAKAKKREEEERSKTEKARLAEEERVRKANKIQEEMEEKRLAEQRAKEEQDRQLASALEEQKRKIAEAKAAKEEELRKIAEAERLKELMAEKKRKEILEKNSKNRVVILVAYTESVRKNPNMKYYGYVNFGDGNGAVEITENEYREYAKQYPDVYTKVTASK